MLPNTSPYLSTREELAAFLEELQNGPAPFLSKARGDELVLYDPHPVGTDCYVAKFERCPMTESQPAFLYSDYVANFPIHWTIWQRMRPPLTPPAKQRMASIHWKPGYIVFELRWVVRGSPSKAPRKCYVHLCSGELTRHEITSLTAKVRALAAR